MPARLYAQSAEIVTEMTVLLVATMMLLRMLVRKCFLTISVRKLSSVIVCGTSEGTR